MAVRISWDKYEVAIILAAGVKVIRKELHRNDAISQVSKILRHKAINQGIEIDSIFRNENGISMQLSKIIALLNGGDSGLAKTKLFNELAELYHTDFNSYYKILVEAKEIVDISDYCADTFLENIDGLAPPIHRYTEITKSNWEYDDIVLIIDLYIFCQMHSNNEIITETQYTSDFLKLRLHNKEVNSIDHTRDITNIKNILQYIDEYYKNNSINESIVDFVDILETSKHNLVKILLDAAEIKIKLKYG